MEFLNEFAAAPAIGVIVYLIAEIFKAVANSREGWLKFIPVLCGVLGGVLGVLGWLLIPGYIPAENIFTAAAIGIISGLAANQIGKQLKKTGAAGQAAQEAEDPNEDQDG